MSGAQRSLVREFESTIVDAGDNLDEQHVMGCVRELLTFDVFDDFRAVEELATRLGSSSRRAPVVLAEIARDVAREDEVRAFAGLAAAIGFRRAAAVAESNSVLAVVDELHVPWHGLPAGVLHLRSVNFLGAHPAGLREGIALSRRANGLLPGSPGFMHALAHLLLEYGIWGDHAKEERLQLWREALELVNGALLQTDWPKFHFTKGRLLLRLAQSEADVSAAMDELRIAAESESKAAFDSGDRRMQYTLERSLAEIRTVVQAGERELTQRLDTTMQQLTERSEQLASRLEEKLLVESRTAQTQAITVIGFVTVALTLVPLGTSLFGFVEKVGLLPVLGGIVVFGIFLWGAVWVATWNLNRGFKRTLEVARRHAGEAARGVKA